MPSRNVIPTAIIVEALGRTMGRVYLAAEQLGCDVSTIYRRAEKSRVIRAAIDRARGKAIDTAEMALWRAVLQGEAWAVCFTLKCLAKDRGYVERQEILHSGGVSLEIVEEIVDGGTQDHEKNGQVAPGSGRLPPQ